MPPLETVGKLEGAPVFELLGAKRSEVSAYASGLLWQDDLALLEREARVHLGDGFRLMKMRLGRDAEYDRNAVAAVARLRQEPRVNRGRVGIHGHSQGGTLAPLVAARSSGMVRFIIASSLSAPSMDRYRRSVPFGAVRRS